MTISQFYKFYSMYGFFFTILLGFFIGLVSNVSIKIFVFGLQLVSLAVQLHAISYINKEEHTPHYKAGDCYSYLPKSEYDKPMLVMVTEVGKEEYVYAFYLPELDKFVINPNHLSHTKFNTFESIYTEIEDCPTSETYFLGE